MEHVLDIVRHRGLRFAIVIAVLLTLTLAIGAPRLNAHAAKTIYADSGSWPTTYLGDNGRTNYNASETIINPSTAPTLQQLWKYTQCCQAPITSQPVVANNLLYWSIWDGHEHASNLLTGKGKWLQFLGISRHATCEPPKIGVASTATIATVSINGQNTSVDFVGGSEGLFYALDANTGKVIWRKPLGNAYGFLWGSPAVYNGSVYIGVSSIPNCVPVQGKFYQLDASTGKVQNYFNVVPKGCVGGSVWGSPTIDEQSGMIYFGTGAADTCSQAEPYANALVELQASNLSYVASWQAPPPPKGYYSQFRSTPTLFQATINGVSYNMVGLPNFNGIYYAFDRSNTVSGPLWQVQLAAPEMDLGTYKINTSSSAWDGTTLYIGGNATVINGQQCSASVRALNPADGSFLWEDCLNSSPVLAPVLAVPGLVVAEAGQSMVVLDATNGTVLFTFTTSRPEAIFQGPATIFNGVLYIGDNHGELFAFTPPGHAH